MYISEVNNKDLNKFFFNDPKLAYLGISDDELSYMYEHKEYFMAPSSIHKGVYKGNHELIAVLKYEKFTNETVNCHVYVASKYHKNVDNIVQEVYDCIKDYLTKEGYYKALIIVPEHCVHIQKAAPKYGFQFEAKITKCYKWRQELCDLLIYSVAFQPKRGLN